MESEIQKIRNAVEQFTSIMKLELYSHISTKSGWDSMELKNIYNRMFQKLNELRLVIGCLSNPPTKEELNLIISESIDVANFAMFMVMNADRLYPTTPE